MHESQLAFLETAAESFPLRGPVYELGVSKVHDAAMPTGLQKLLSEVSYMAWNLPAPSCDEPREETQRLPFSNGAARTVVLTNLLEQVHEPRQVFEEILRILAPSGMLLLCCSTERSAPLGPRAWQPTPGEMQSLLACLDATLVGWQGAERQAHTLYGIGCKPPVPETFLAGVNGFLTRFQQRLDRLAARETWRRKFRRWLAGWRATPLERAKRRDYLKTQFVLHLPVDDHFRRGLLAGSTPHSHLGSRLNRRV